MTTNEAVDTAEWVHACSEQDLSRSRRHVVTVAGQSVLLLQLPGEIRAVRNECPHRKVGLDTGELSGRHIVCSLHRRHYDLDSGRCETPRPDGTPRRDTPPLTFYRAVVQDGQVWVTGS
jgi:nitrite reductase/ring-hydroxylating ferredoxin subunit